MTNELFAPVETLDVNIGVRFSVAVADEVDALADRHKLTRAAVVRQLVQLGLERVANRDTEVPQRVA